MNKKLGDAVEKGESLATLHHARTTNPETAAQLLSHAMEIRLQKTKSPPLIKAVMGTNMKATK